jgi:hypothetical protein
MTAKTKRADDIFAVHHGFGQRLKWQLGEQTISMAGSLT